MTRTRKTAGTVLAVIVLLLVGVGGSSLALQTLSNSEMDQVSGRDAIYIGVGQGFDGVTGKLKALSGLAAAGGLDRSDRTSANARRSETAF